MQATLEADRAGRATRSIWRSRPLLIAAIAIAIVLALLIAIPQTREAIAQLLGLRFIQIVPVTPTPTSITTTPAPITTPGVAPIDQCCPTTLDKARQQARFAIRLPLDATPSQVFFQDQLFGPGSPAQQLILVFGDPQAPRFVLYEAESWLYQKTVTASGAPLGSGTTISETTVGGRRAEWLSGAPHLLVTLDQKGEPILGSERPVNANTLIWDIGSGSNVVTFRLETTLSLSEAVRFAESLR